MLGFVGLDTIEDPDVGSEKMLGFVGLDTIADPEKHKSAEKLKSADAPIIAIKSFSLVCAVEPAKGLGFVGLATGEADPKKPNSAVAPMGPPLFSRSIAACEFRDRLSLCEVGEKGEEGESEVRLETTLAR